MPNPPDWFQDTDRRQVLWAAIKLVDTMLLTMMPARLDRVWGTAMHHYTDLGTAEKLIQRRNLWLTDARYCNDREEMLHAVGVIEAACVCRVSTNLHTCSCHAANYAHSLRPVVPQ